MTDQARQSAGPAPLLRQLLAQLAALGVLFGFAYALAGLRCWALFPAAALIAWPIWVYGTETSLFERRLYLDQLTTETSALRRWLWAGNLIRVLQAIAAFLLALVLLAFAANLKAEEWVILFADVILLALLARLMHGWLAGEARPDRIGIVVRRWPLLGVNIVILATAFAAQAFVVGEVDTRALGWNAVAEQAFLAAADQTRCTLAGWAVGVLAAGDALTWHLAQITSTGVSDTTLQLGIWASVLFKAGVVGYLFTRLQLGVQSTVEQVSSPRPRGSRITSAFVVTILLLAIPYFYAMAKLSQLDVESLGEKAQEVVALADPCRLDPAKRRQILETIGIGLRDTQQQARDAAGAQIETGVAEIIADLDPAIDAYLDWYFTLMGEYERLAALLTGDFLATMTAKFEHHLFEESGLTERLTDLEERVSARSLSRLKASVAGIRSHALADALPRGCRQDGQLTGALAPGFIEQQLDRTFHRDATGAATAVGGGAVAAVASLKLIAKKAGASAASKVATTKSFQAAASLAAKAGAKKGGGALVSGATAAALCSPAGPAAVACGVAAGVLAWVTIDKAAVEIDEYLNRDALRNDIVQALNETVPEISGELIRRQNTRIDAALMEISGSLPFRPIEQLK